eukprot:10249870-Alexandrium_andersonii.AAC.1
MLYDGTSIACCKLPAWHVWGWRVVAGTPFAILAGIRTLPTSERYKPWHYQCLVRDDAQGSKVCKRVGGPE